MSAKRRLTVTLSRDLVEQLDRMIDRRTVRSRSHAVELLLRRAITPRVTTAILLAGGERPGRELPALSPFGGRALISIMAGHLTRFGVRRILVLAGERVEELRGVLGDGSHLGAEVEYLVERQPRGTAGALVGVRPRLGDEPVMVIHGDVLTDLDLDDFVDFHLREGTLATMAVKPRHAEREYGRVMLQGNRITDFFDSGGGRGIAIVNAGVYLFQPEALGMIDDQAPSMLESDVFPRLARMGELSAFLFQGIWFDVRNERNYRQAKARWRRRGERPDEE